MDIALPRFLISIAAIGVGYAGTGAGVEKSHGKACFLQPFSSMWGVASDCLQTRNVNKRGKGLIAPAIFESQRNSISTSPIIP
jgi:hypothetical protein